MKTIWYGYLNAAAHGVITDERNPGIGPISSCSGGTGGDTATETRLDGGSSSYIYSHIHHCVNNPEGCSPCDDEGTNGPDHQQVLLNFTVNGQTTQLGYDTTSWFVNSVTDARQNTTGYVRGGVIGEIQRINYPGGAFKLYGYGADKHYITSV